MTNYLSKINANNTNYTIGGNGFYGQWVYFQTRVTLVSTDNVSAEGIISCDLSSYLPNDGYDYEVLVSGNAWTPSSSYSSVGLTVASGNINTHNEGLFLRLARTDTRTSSSHGVYGSGIIPIYSNNRTISVCNHDASGKSGSYSVYLHGYRRINANKTLIKYGYRLENTYDYYWVYVDEPLKLYRTSNGMPQLVGTGTQMSEISLVVSGQLYYRYTPYDIYDYDSNLIKNINNYSIGGNNFDGQWVWDRLTIIDGSTMNSNATVDFTNAVSNYLPDSSHRYEILVVISFVTGTSSGNTAKLHLKTSESDSYMPFAAVVTRTSSNESDRRTAIISLPPQNRTLTMLNDGDKTGSIYMDIVGYRRIGDNT